MIKSKKQSLIVIGAFVLVLLLGTTTYAFFNYTRTGSNNVIRVGRISFESKNEETITLNNLFPIDPSNTTDMNDNTKVGTYSIDIKGDTDYVDGIEYLVSVTDSNITTLPINIDISVSSGLGTSNTNYFTAREDKNANIYKKLVGDTLVGDQMLLVGFIKPNTTSGTAEGVDGNITIKAYLDKNKILISDTYDGTESDNMGTPNSMAQGKTVLTTTEWNQIQTNGVSFKVKVEANEGIWVKGSLEEIMRQENFDTTKNRGILDNEQSTFVSASTGIDFGAISSDTNGKGVYMRAGTENDLYPIMYYRGAVEDNNVVFNNKCWKAVRTTDTGGVKLVYNGLPQNIYEGIAESDYNVLTNTNNMFSYDNSTTKWTGIGTSSGIIEFEFTVPNSSDYILDVIVKTSSSSGGTLDIYINDASIYNENNGGGAVLAYRYNAGTISSSDKIKLLFDGSCSSNYPLIFEVKMYRQSSNVIGQSCDNKGINSQITLNINGIDTSTFTFSGNNLENSPAYVGYMWGTVYESNTSDWVTNAKFGSSFTWDGTNYKLIDAIATTPDSTHHYSCNNQDADAICSDLRYVYFESGSTKKYIILTDGDGVEQALEKMRTNTNDSNAKAQIDTWYASNMNTITSKLEDTIWCNDRSELSEMNGWIANGGILSKNLSYNPSQRQYYEYNPNLICANKNDRFTVNNSDGNRKLDYPVALLTMDEMMLAGANSRRYNRSFYLNSELDYWSMSPIGFDGQYESASITVVDYVGNFSNISSSALYGLRPSVSLKPGQPVISGTGTVLEPYVIG